MTEAKKAKLLRFIDRKLAKTQKTVDELRGQLTTSPNDAKATKTLSFRILDISYFLQLKDVISASR